MMRRRSSSKKPYTISYLLSKQPKSIKKHPQYPALLHYYNYSPRLRSVRFSRRCYSLLLHAKIAPENLKYFYRTYRLPRDPFFPLYFMIKRDYLKQKERRKQEKIQYIAARMRALDPAVLRFIRFLAVFEQRCNYGNRYPIWSEHLFPKTKKKVHEYKRYRYEDWLAFFRTYMQLLHDRYRTVNGTNTEKLFACFVLECAPEEPLKKRKGSVHEIELPDPDFVVGQFRKLSKLHHPDRGGSADIFRHLKWARDVLLA